MLTYINDAHGYLAQFHRNEIPLTTNYSEVTYLNILRHLPGDNVLIRCMGAIVPNTDIDVQMRNIQTFVAVKSQGNYYYWYRKKTNAINMEAYINVFHMTVQLGYNYVIYIHKYMILMLRTWH